MFRKSRTGSVVFGRRHMYRTTVLYQVTSGSTVLPPERCVLLMVEDSVLSQDSIALMMPVTTPDISTHWRKPLPLLVRRVRIVVDLGVCPMVMILADQDEQSRQS
jgi:hypothetical protein